MKLEATGERDLGRLLSSMAPALDPEHYGFCLAPAGGLPAGIRPIARVEEAEGETVILTAREAELAGLRPVFPARRITLTVHSDLGAVGLLSRIADRFTRLGIPCNAVAGIHHDHLFVPPSQAAAAMSALATLQQEASGGGAASVFYVVRIAIAADAAEEWRDWMQGVHLPAVLATGCFEEVHVSEELEPSAPPGRRVFQMQYRALSLGRVEEYRSHFAPALQQAHTSRYAGRFEATRSVQRWVGVVSR